MNVEQYLLNILMEELSEMIKATSKCIRFGKDHQYEEYNTTN